MSRNFFYGIFLMEETFFSSSKKPKKNPKLFVFFVQKFPGGSFWPETEVSPCPGVYKGCLLSPISVCLSSDGVQKKKTTGDHSKGRPCALQSQVEWPAILRQPP